MREDAGQKELSIWWSELCFEIDWASAGCLSLRCWWRLPSDPYDLKHPYAWHSYAFYIWCAALLFRFFLSGSSLLILSLNSSSAFFWMQNELPRTLAIFSIIATCFLRVVEVIGKYQSLLRLSFYIRHKIVYLPLKSIRTTSSAQIRLHRHFFAPITISFL